MIEELDDSIKIFFLMYYYGYKYQEIVDYLELLFGMVKSCIFFVCKEFKEVIGKCYENLSEFCQKVFQ